MRQRLVWVAAAAAAAGCTSVPPLENPVLVRPASADAENPVLVQPGGPPTPEGYAFVYSQVLDAVDDYFEIVPGDRYSGQIETKPKPAAGFERAFVRSTPSARERLIATVQSIRHRAIVRIAPGERGGYRVSVEVYKDLEDVGQPIGASRGPAMFREGPTLDRRLEVVSPAAPVDKRWIPIGRDLAYEQVLLKKIQVAVCR